MPNSHEANPESSTAVVHLRGAFRKIGANNPCKEQCLHLHIIGKTEV
jgi:hypothetical protein